MKNKEKIETFLLQEKTTKIFITHDFNFAKKCTKVFLLENGQLTEVNKNNLT